MKPLLVFTTIWLAMSGGAPSQPSERSAIQAVLDVHAEAWTRGDAHAAAAVMTEDADWVSGGGRTFQGREAIEQMHRELLAGPAKGTRHVHPGTPSIRFLRSDVAIVDGDSYVGAPGTQVTPDDFNHYTAIFVKEKGRWMVAAFRLLPQVKPSVTTLNK
ncbi:MAG: SgcJ/EcaC family oxidoreductase [Terriglobales bacterium]